MSELVRCHYDGSLGDNYALVVENAVGRAAQFAGMGLCSGQRDLGWSVNSKAEAERIRERLRTCPEVTIVETTDGE